MIGREPVDYKRDDNPDDTADSRDHRVQRTPVTLVVDYDGADDLVVDYTENLSQGGVFLRTGKQLSVGTKIRLMLSFPGLLKSIGITGTVRWTRDADEFNSTEPGSADAGDNRPGVGIEFDDNLGRKKLRDLVYRVRDRDPELVSRLIRILVVEDNPHVAQLIRSGLSGSGKREFGSQLAFNFRTAGNGREALEILRSETFDAVIIDIYLPVMDGANVIREIRNDAYLAAIPIIAVSAGGETTRIAALDAGADFFLAKPMRLRHIVDTMRKLIDLGS